MTRPWEGPVVGHEGKTDIITWKGHTTATGGVIRGSRRSIAYLQFLEQELARDHPDCRLVIWQSAYNTTVDASAGSHDYDAAYDLQIVGMDWLDAQRWLRRKGFACWFRPELIIDGRRIWGNHIHGIVLGFTTRVGSLIPGQVSDYHNNRNGLSSHAPDNSWHPHPQFVFDMDEWLKQQEDDLNADDKKWLDGKFDAVNANVNRLETSLNEFRENEVTRDQEDAQRDADMVAKVDRLLERVNNLAGKVAELTAEETAS